jgi:hypothetical protein
MLEDMVAWLAAEWREPASFDRFPSIGVSLQPAIPRSPAEPASASPVTDNSSSIPIQRGNQMRFSTSLNPPPRGCHLYFARRVTFLSCADTSDAGLLPYRELDDAVGPRDPDADRPAAGAARTGMKGFGVERRGSHERGAS